MWLRLHTPCEGPRFDSWSGSQIPQQTDCFWAGLQACAGSRPRNQEGRSSQVVTVFYWKTLIYIFLHSLNTNIARFEKKRKTKTLRKRPQLHAYLPLPSALGWVSRYAPPPLPWRLVPQGGREDSQSWAGPRKSHLIDLRGGVG